MNATAPGFFRLGSGSVRENEKRPRTEAAAHRGPAVHPGMMDGADPSFVSGHGQEFSAEIHGTALAPTPPADHWAADQVPEFFDPSYTDHDAALDLAEIENQPSVAIVSLLMDDRGGSSSCGGGEGTKADELVIPKSILVRRDQTKAPLDARGQPVQRRRGGGINGNIVPIPGWSRTQKKRERDLENPYATATKPKKEQPKCVVIMPAMPR